MRMFLIAIVVILSCAALAPAAVVYSYEAERPTYGGPAGSTVDVNVYLHETLSGGSVSPIPNADPQLAGLFSAAVKLQRTGGTSTVTSAVSANGIFDGTVDLITAPDNLSATIYGDRASGFGPGLLPDTNGRMYVGTFRVTVPTVGVSTYSLSDYDATATSIQVLTYDFDELDWMLSPGGFSVTVPEPSGLSLLGLAGLLALRRWRSA